MISLIVAIDKNRLIGDSNGLPWYIPEDLKYFRDTTIGKTIVMGRKTYQSIGRLLPHRQNIIVSRQNLNIEGALIVNNFGEYLKNIADEQEIFIIGGAEIYREALPYVSKLYITHVDAEYEGDTYFPHEYFEKELRVISKSEITSERGVKLTFAIYQVAP